MASRNIELEREILKAPADPAGYLVYADWLQAQGDPRGELIVLHHRDGNADAFIIAHDKELLGRFADDKPDTFKLEWRLGFIRKAMIGWGQFDGEDEDNTSADQLEAFLKLDSARLIEALVIGPTPEEDMLDFGPHAQVIEDIAPPALRELYLGDTSDWDISSTSTRMPKSASLRELRKLELRGGSVYLDAEIDLPELTMFSVESGCLTVPELRAIAAARWPKLEELEIWFGDPNYGAKGSADDIAAIFDGRGLANLRTLRLRNCAFADELANRLIGSKILAQLHTLDLSMGNLSDRGMAAMLASTARFAHLDKLVVSDNALTDANWPAARALAKTVEYGTDHSPERAVPRAPGDREHYVAVGE